MRALWLLSLLFATAIWAAPFEQTRQIQIPGTYYFTPARSGGEWAAFGYVSKVEPTPEELEAHEKRMRTIIDEGIRREYGSWEKYEKAMREAGRKAAAREESGAPSWVKRLMPPAVVQEAVPLFLKGALTYAKSHPEASKEPIGNLGETGVILVSGRGEWRKVALGIDQPVLSLDFSPDGRELAVLTDLSVEDSKGRYHPVGRIDVLAVPSGKRLYSAIFANAVDEVCFTSDGESLTFLVENPKKWNQKALRFIDRKTWRLEKRTLLFDSRDSSGEAFGKSYRVPHYRFSPNGERVALLLKDGGIGLFDTKSLRPVFEIEGGGGAFVFAHTRPWLFDDNGRLWNYETKTLRWRTKESYKPYRCVAFLPGDGRIVASTIFGALRIFDAETGRTVAASRRHESYAGLFFPSRDGRHIFGFMSAPHNRFAAYRGCLKRRAVALKVLDASDLRLRQLVDFADSTVLDATAGDDALFISDFDTIHIYRRSER
ncbi:WD40 repeat domain-containing protein [Hydrogenimonas cancrithermarum]|uniref:WD40 repeat domain-containing protein n=1 Tax=Hydrogenimonas cancrithermarum TaxID=2993563 RepID=A0ABM8FMU5_9BACT|nr:WD40 repeat domain-containing protein [Hydrogenimonas cancrithermarum]BDY12844.1 hypothetical protein HCR_11560 [Hydrogenimonas cancrithermarum]BDY12961.1 hypothetical protein HCR_12730 [Hydrogenimonas cancrithermarum]